MNRCAKPLIASFFIAACAFLASAAAIFPSDAQAQAQRRFPPKAERGTISFGGGREVLLNAKADYLAAGAQVRNERNTIVMPGTLQASAYTVNYLRDPRGQLREVWILTPAEIERPLPGKAGGLRDSGPDYAN